MTYENILKKYEKLELKQLKSKNDKVKSQYIHLCEKNEGRERSLVTLTVVSLNDKQEQLLLIKDIKNYFVKRLQNLKSNVQYFSVIELGKNRNNPHLHSQLFYDKQDEERIEDAYLRTLKHFNLDSSRCKLLLDDKQLSSTSSHNYIIKEYDNKKLSDGEITKINKSRNKLKDGESKHLQFYSKSRPTQTQPIYKKLWFDYGMTYNNVNELFKKGYAKRYKIEEINYNIKFYKYPYIHLKDSVIEINIVKLYDLIFLTAFFLNQRVSSEKCIYCNKRTKKRVLTPTLLNFLYNSKRNRQIGINNGYERVRYRNERRRTIKL